MTAQTDFINDDRDGVLFRFWIRAASYPGGWPGRLHQLFTEETKDGKNMTPECYRRALTTLALEKGVNLP